MGRGGAGCYNYGHGHDDHYHDGAAVHPFLVVVDDFVDDVDDIVGEELLLRKIGGCPLGRPILQYQPTLHYTHPTHMSSPRSCLATCNI